MIDVDCLSEAAVVLVEIDGVLAGFIGSPVETKSTLRESASGNDRRPKRNGMSAMARELVERNGIGETADAVWKALNTEHQKQFPTNSDPDHTPLIEAPAALLGTRSDPAGLVEEAIESSSVLIFGQRPGSLTGRRPRGR